MRARSRVTVAGVGTVACLVLAACSSSSSGGTKSSSSGSASSAATTTAATQVTTAAGTTTAPTSGVTHAKEQVAKYEAVPATLAAPGPALAKQSSLKGKTFYFIPLGINIPVFAAVTAGVKQAATAAGINLKVCDGNLNPSTISNCINQAVNASASGVIGDGFTPGFVQQAVNSLAAHHIPFLDSDHAQGGGTDTLAYLGNNSYLQSILAADWIISDSGGKAHILAIENTEDPVTSSFLTEGGLKEISKYCPGCTVTIVKTTAEQLNLLPSAVGAALVRNPKIDYAFPEFDEDASATIQGLSNSTHGSSVKLASTTGLLPDLQRIHDAKNQNADAGNNPTYMGWAEVDDVMRMALGMKPIDNEFVPVRLFDTSNVTSLSLTADAFQSGAWYGNSSFTTTFKGLWK